MKKQHAIILLLLSAFWSIFLLKTQTINSGIHFQDDHEIISIYAELKDNNYNLLTVFSNRMDREVNVIHRFRPFFYFHRVVEVAVFKNNFLAYSVYHLVLTILTSWFFYLFATKIGLGLTESVLFPIIVQLGEQSEVIWMLGTCETIGIFSYSLALLCLTGMIKSTARSNLYGFGYCAFSILSALSKESFILIIPAAMLLQIWLLKGTFKLTWIRATKVKFVPLAVMGIFTLSVLLYIKNYVGTGISYAGVDASISFLKYYSTFVGFITSKNRALAILLSSIVALIALGYYSRKGTDNYRVLSEFVDLCLFLIFFSALIIFPQVILYTKSGLVARYCLPISISIAYLLFLPQSYVAKLIVVNKVRLLLIGFFFLANFTTAYANFKAAKSSADFFVQNGYQSNGIINSISNNVSSNKEKIILVVIDPYEIPSLEISGALKTFIRHHLNKDNPVYFQFVSRSEQFNKKLTVNEESFSSQLFMEAEGKTIDEIADKSNISSVIIFEGLEENFLSKSQKWFLPSKFKRIQGNKFSHYYE